MFVVVSRHLIMKVLVFILLGLSFGFTRSADSILGHWNTEEDEATIEIYKENGKYYGKVEALKIPMEEGRPRKDIRNRDEKLKNRDIQGILLFYDMEYNAKSKRWENGRVYDPYQGYDAECIITLADANTIKIKGYLRFEWINKYQTWKRKAKD